MEHSLVFAVVTEEGHVLAEIHVLEVIGDKTTVATLDAFAKIFDNVSFGFHLFDDTSLGSFDKLRQYIDFSAVSDLFSYPFNCLAGI